MTDPTPPPEHPPAGWLPPPLSGGWPPSTQGWVPPSPQPPPQPARALPPQPGGPPRRRWAAVAIVAGALVLVGGTIAAWVLLGPSVSPGPSPAPVPTAPVEVDGGDLGKAVPLKGPDGAGTVTVEAARWLPDGELAPAEGTSYLVLDVALTGTSGDLAVGGIFTVAIGADGERHGIAYGPKLDPLLASTVLRPGDTTSGQLGYQLAPGDTRIEFQSPTGAALGTVEVPGP